MDYISAADINVMSGNVFTNEAVGVYFHIYLDEIPLKLTNKSADQSTLQIVSTIQIQQFAGQIINSFYIESEADPPPTTHTNKFTAKKKKKKNKTHWNT